MFILDSSGSIGEQNFNKFKSFLREVLNQIDMQSCDYRFGALKFGSNAFVQYHLNRYRVGAAMPE